jgi:hypothetical protein
MAIARYENLTVQNVVTATDAYGQQVTTTTTWFETRARVQDVRNSLQINKDDRVYTDLVKFTMNYTPNMKQVVDYQNQYAINWRNAEWRITDVMESNDRMNVTLFCYRNDPTVSV